MSVDAAASLEASLVAAANADDGSAFVALIDRYRPELQLHCYRMLGSLQDAEDLVQETFLRAWSKRRSFQRRSTVRAWLYRIATNACLDVLRRSRRRVLPPEVADPADPTVPLLPPLDLPWLGPYPDRLIDEIASTADGPDAVVIRRESTELAFLATIQHLPPKQRAVLILRDVLDWSAAETASALETSVASVNSALQRAHATLARYLPTRDRDWLAGDSASESEQLLLGQWIDALEHRDPDAVAALLREDARMTMPPTPSWYQGREAITTFFTAHAWSTHGPGEMRYVATAANRQPAFAMYLRAAGEATYEAFGLVLLRIERGAIAETVLFPAPLGFARSGLAARI